MNKILKYTAVAGTLVLVTATSKTIVTNTYDSQLYTSIQELTNARDEISAIKNELSVAHDDLKLAQQQRDAALAKTIELANENEELSNKLALFVDPVEYQRAEAPIYNIPLSEELQQYTYETCLDYGIADHYELVLAIMWHESRFTADAISRTNDYGIMQINICNHERLRNKLGIVDIMDVQSNIECGVYMISTLLHQYDDDEHKALMAYNMGPGRAAVLWSRGTTKSNYSTSVISKARMIQANDYDPTI